MEVRVQLGPTAQKVLRQRYFAHLEPLAMKFVRQARATVSNALLVCIAIHPTARSRSMIARLDTFASPDRRKQSPKMASALLATTVQKARLQNVRVPTAHT